MRDRMSSSVGDVPFCAQRVDGGLLDAHEDPPPGRGRARRRKHLVKKRLGPLRVRARLATLEDDAGRVSGNGQTNFPSFGMAAAQENRPSSEVRAVVGVCPRSTHGRRGWRVLVACG